MSSAASEPHRGQPVLAAGPSLEQARGAVIVVHGRGGSAQDSLRLARNLAVPEVAWLAPQAADNEWYPQRFIAPVASNEPGLSSALGVMQALVDRAVAAGIPRERVILGGFSQGACLALETAVRLGGRFGGVFALSGGLIGPPGAPRPHDRPIGGTPVFLACGDADAHIPIASVRESTAILKNLGGAVHERIYPGLGHIIVSDEINHTVALIEKALGRR